MEKTERRRALVVVSLATALSLMGDSTMYTVLPTHTSDAGVTLAAVGVLLSANRFVRLALNSPVGLLSDRWPRRRIFVPAVWIGVLSTASYALSQSFWPLLAGRLLWGLAWAGLWVGGNAIVLDTTHHSYRGRWVGAYQFAFFLGAAGGSMFGGALTDWLGYRAAMGLAASATAIGALSAWLFLPETGHLRTVPGIEQLSYQRENRLHDRSQLIGAGVLYGLNRLVVAGVLVATLGYFLAQRFGENIIIGNRVLGVATVTGVALGASTLIGMVTAPVAGMLSDRFTTRWGVVAGGLGSGLVGFSSLAFGSVAGIVIGLPLVSAGSGSNQGLATAIVGDFSMRTRHGRRLGILFTVGDLGSALGPPIAYWLLPVVGLATVYRACAGLVAIMFFVAIGWSIKGRGERQLSRI